MLIVQCMWYVYFYFTTVHVSYMKCWKIQIYNCTNNEMRFIGDVYMFLCPVSVGQCVNRTSGYWLIRLLGIDSLCSLSYLHSVPVHCWFYKLLETCTRATFTAAAEFFLIFFFLNLNLWIFLCTCTFHRAYITVRQTLWIRVTRRLQYWLHDWYSAGILWIAWNNCSVNFYRFFFLMPVVHVTKVCILVVLLF